MNDFLSIPSLASHLGVTPPAVRSWINQGLIPAPSNVTATGEQAYDGARVEEIQRWYAERASTHSTRGPGAADRRDQALALLREQGEEVR